MFEELLDFYPQAKLIKDTLGRAVLVFEDRNISWSVTNLGDKVLVSGFDKFYQSEFNQLEIDDLDEAIGFLEYMEHRDNSLFISTSSINKELYNFWLDTQYQMMYRGDTITDMDYSELSDRLVVSTVSGNDWARDTAFVGRELITNTNGDFDMNHFMVVMPIAHKLFGDK